MAELLIKNQLTQCYFNPSERYLGFRCRRPAVRFYFSGLREDFEYVLFCETHSNTYRDAKGAKARYFVIGRIRE